MSRGGAGPARARRRTAEPGSRRRSRLLGDEPERRRPLPLPAERQVLVRYGRDHGQDRRALRSRHRRGRRARTLGRGGDPHHRALLGLRQERDDALRQPGQTGGRAVPRLLRRDRGLRRSAARSHARAGAGAARRRRQPSRRARSGARARTRSSRDRAGARAVSGGDRRARARRGAQPRGAAAGSRAAGTPARSALPCAGAARPGARTGAAPRSRRGSRSFDAGALAARARSRLDRQQGGAHLAGERRAGAERLRPHARQPGGRRAAVGARGARCHDTGCARRRRDRLRARSGRHSAARRVSRALRPHRGGQRDRGPRHRGHPLGRSRRREPVGRGDWRPGRQVHPDRRRPDRRERHEQGLQRGHRLVPRGTGGVLRHRRHRGVHGAGRTSRAAPGSRTDVHRVRCRRRGRSARRRLRAARSVRGFPVLGHPQLQEPCDGPAQLRPAHLLPGQARQLALARVGAGRGRRSRRDRPGRSRRDGRVGHRAGRARRARRGTAP